VLQNPAYAGSKNERKEGGKMQDLNKCPQCGRLLIAYEEVIALNGQLFCSNHCVAIVKAKEVSNEYPHLNSYDAYEVAKMKVASEAEVVRTEDVLGEDLQEVQIAVTYYKTIKLPRNMSEAKMLETAEGLWQDGIVCAEPDDCDDVRFECSLVKSRNSEHNMED
jgi:hypothetical protein